MTKKDLFEISLKIVGIYFLTIAFNGFLGILKIFPDLYNSQLEISSYLLIIIVALVRVSGYLIGFWLLTLKTNYILKKIKLSDSQSNQALNLKKFDLQQILFQTAGILILYFAINDLLNEILLTALRNLSYMYVTFVFLVPILKFVFGALLLFTPSYIIRILNKKSK